MRATVTLDDDVVQMFEEARYRERKLFKQVVNEAPRRVFVGKLPPSCRQRRVSFPVFDSALLPGVDAGSFNRLVDDLEQEAAVEELGR